MVEGEGGVKEGEGYKGGRQQCRLGLGKPSLLTPRPTVYAYVGLLHPEIRVKVLELSLSLSTIQQLLSRVLTKNGGDQPTAWQPHQEHE